MRKIYYFGIFIKFIVLFYSWVILIMKSKLLSPLVVLKNEITYDI